MESTSAETSAYSPGYSLAAVADPWTDYREPKSDEWYHVTGVKLFLADRTFPHFKSEQPATDLVSDIFCIARLAHLPLAQSHLTDFHV